MPPPPLPLSLSLSLARALSLCVRYNATSAAVHPHRLLVGSHLVGLGAIAFYYSRTHARTESQAALWVLAVGFGAAAAVWFPNGLALGTHLMYVFACPSCLDTFNVGMAQMNRLHHVCLPFRMS